MPAAHVDVTPHNSNVVGPPARRHEVEHAGVQVLHVRHCASRVGAPGSPKLVGVKDALQHKGWRLDELAAHVSDETRPRGPPVCGQASWVEAPACVLRGVEKLLPWNVRVRAPCPCLSTVYTNDANHITRSHVMRA